MQAPDSTGLSFLKVTDGTLNINRYKEPSKNLIEYYYNNNYGVYNILHMFTSNYCISITAYSYEIITAANYLKRHNITNGKLLIDTESIPNTIKLSNEYSYFSEDILYQQPKFFSRNTYGYLNPNALLMKKNDIVKTIISNNFIVITEFDQLINKL